MRIALGLAYDGAGFPGWQTQSCGRAVQDVLEVSLARMAGHPVRTLCAGRTDAGVHALAQVVHFDTPAVRPPGAWGRGVNARLPRGVTVQWARPVPDGFHARFSARHRSYRYLIWCGAVPHPLWRDRAGWVFRALDLTAMRQAACLLVGEHDFSAFRSAQCQAASPVRRLSRLDITPRGDFVELCVTANAFLHHMVRNLVGVLVDVGIGRRPVPWVGQVLASRRRALASPTFSPAGLYLAEVDYDPGFGLPGGLLDPLGPMAPPPMGGRVPLRD